MNGVSITTRLVGIFQTTIFGAMSGPGIFMAQYYGNKDKKGFKRAFQYQVIIGLLIFVAAVAIFVLKGKDLIYLFLESEYNSAEDVLTTYQAAQTYLNILIFSFLPLVFTQVLATSLRSTGDTMLPMASSVAAVLVNLLFNYLLIGGHLGFPALGVAGAGYATLISRFIEVGILIIGLIVSKNEYFLGLFNHLELRLDSVRMFLQKSAPLLCNELLYSLSNTVLDQRYSIYGLTSYASINIASTVYYVFMISCISMGTATSIVIGQTLGTGDIERAKKEDEQILRLNVAIGILFGLLLFLASPIMPTFYDVEEEVKTFATVLLRIDGCFIPVMAIYYTCYFTLRAGGKTFLTMVFDSGYNWCITIPAAFILTLFTDLPILPVFIIIRLLDIPKAIIGLTLLHKGIWAVNLSLDNDESLELS